MAAAINSSMPHRFCNNWRYCFGFGLALFLLCSHSSFAVNLKLAWDPSTDSTVAGYNLAYGTTSGKYTKSVDAGSSTSATVPLLVPGTTYYFVVTAYNSAGLQGAPSNEVALTLPENVPPSVSLTSPQAGTFDDASPIGLTATATDSDGTVVKVEFYEDTTKIGEAADAPYSATWANPSAGSHTLTALAYDDSGAAVRSAGIPVTVNSQTATPSPSPSPSASPTSAIKVKVMATTSLIKAGQSAKFKIATTDPQTQSMNVNYALSGTAVSGINYSLAGATGQVTIPTGDRSAILSLGTLSTSGGNKTITVTIMPGAAYTPARSSSATIKILSR